MPTRIGLLNRNASAPTAFLSDEQRELLRNAGRKAIERANASALQTALRASLEHNDGLTAAQKFARETGDPRLIQEADDQALALGVMRSLDPDNDAKKPVRSLVPNDEFAAQYKVIDGLRQQLLDQGVIIKKNNGDNNNCLLISMLQHVTGNYDSNHTRMARHYKALLTDWSGGRETRSSSLFSDDALARQLVRKINEDFFKEQRENYLSFTFVTADLDGNPCFRTVGDGRRTAWILDGGGHYEACIHGPTQQDAENANQAPR